MNIEIRKLTPDLVDDYMRFFDTTPHNGDKDENKCYCVTWCGDKAEGDRWYPSSDERRSHAIRRVQEGNIQGYLAYCDDEIVGWCNANTKADCQSCINYLSYDANVPIEECHAGEKIKFIFCFAIAPKAQRKGVATQLLDYICRDAAADGFDFVEAHSKIKFASASNAFRGHLAMYEKCGFSIAAEQADRVVVQKALR